MALDSYLTRQLIEECEKHPVETLEHRLKEFDRMIEELEERREIVRQKIRDLRGSSVMSEDEQRQEIALRAAQELGLPCPRLQLTWLPLDADWERKECLYTLALPLRASDIRRDTEEEVGVRREHHGRLGRTTSTGGGRPVRNSQVDTPFRDGCHANWDGEVLGLPVYAVCESFATRVERTKRDDP